MSTHKASIGAQHRVLHEQTPVHYSMPLRAHLGGKSVYLKMECYQPVGSYKIRGLGRLCQQYQADGKKHLVSASAGNAGYATSYAAHELGMDAVVFVPETTPQAAIDNIRAWGAEVRVGGADWDGANEAALAFVEETGGAYIPPFDHPTIWDGHATMADELVQQMPKPDVVVAAVGGGGLASGLLQGMHAHDWADVPLITVETEGAASFATACEKGEHIALDHVDTIAVTLGAHKVCDALWEWRERHTIIPTTVTDAASVSACLKFLDDHYALVEPACGAALSLLYDQSDLLEPYENILVIVCGGVGVSLEQLLQYSA